MNPITRMMKRYIKMPLKYALPLLFIGSLVLVSTTGCTDNTATPTPTATPTATSGGHDAFLSKWADAYKSDALSGSQSGLTHHTVDITWDNATPPLQTVEVNNGWFNDASVMQGIHAIITKYPTTAEATKVFNTMTTDSDTGKAYADDGHGVHGALANTLLKPDTRRP